MISTCHYVLFLYYSSYTGTCLAGGVRPDLHTQQDGRRRDPFRLGVRQLLSLAVGLCGPSCLGLANRFSSNQIMPGLKCKAWPRSVMASMWTLQSADSPICKLLPSKSEVQPRAAKNNILFKLGTPFPLRLSTLKTV